MSSKLVKKLLNQTNTQLESDDAEEYHHQTGSGVRTKTRQKITREEAIQGHIQSILRLDTLVQESKSFDRRTTALKLQAKKQRQLKKIRVAGNSRSSSSSFSKQQQQPTFNKVKAKRKKEEDYYSDIARALKKAKRKKK